MTGLGSQKSYGYHLGDGDGDGYHIDLNAGDPDAYLMEERK